MMSYNVMKPALVVPADYDACQVADCSSIAHAVNNSCVDLAAPSLDYSCSCDTGYSWNASGLTCVGEW
jgi:hypothetical protein